MNKTKLSFLAVLSAAALALSLPAGAAVGMKIVAGASCAAAVAPVPITTTGGTVALSLCVTTDASERVCGATYPLRSTNAAANAAAVQVQSRTATAPFTNVQDLVVPPVTLTSTSTATNFAQAVPASGVQAGGMGATVKIADLTLTIPSGLPSGTTFTYDVEAALGEVATVTGTSDCNDIVNGTPVSNGPGVALLALATPAAPSTAIFSISNVSITEGGATANAVVTCTGAFASNTVTPVAVAFSTTNAAGNFTTSASPVSFAACGGATQSIVVTPRVDDALVQGTVGGNIVLGSVTTDVGASIASGGGAVTVLDNDAPPVFSLAKAGACAEAVVPINCSFSITRDSGVTTATTVNFTVAGTATRGTDYTLKTGGCAAGTVLSGTLISHPNASALVIDVCPIDDLLVETGGETVIFTLTANPPTYTVGTASQTQVIADDDSPQTVSVAVTGSPGTEAGGVLTYTFTRTGGSAAALAASLAVNITPPTASARYSSTCTSPITFAAAATTATCTVTGINNAVADGNINAVVAVAPPTVVGAYTVGTPASATGIIADDEIGVSVIGSGTTEGGNVSFSISCTGPAASTATVTFAISGQDAGATITPAAGPVTVTCGTPTIVTVTTTNDAIVGNNRAVTLTLSAPVSPAVLVGSASASAAVTDNDQRVAPTSIPTMGVFGLGLMSLMLVGFAAFQRRRYMK